MAPKKKAAGKSNPNPRGPAREPLSETIRHLDHLMEELEDIVQDSRAKMNAISERTCAQVDQLYNILRTEPEETLDTPFREEQQKSPALATPPLSVASAALASSAASTMSAVSASSSNPGEGRPNTEQMPHTQAAASAEAKQVGQARSEPSGGLEDLRMGIFLTQPHAAGSLHDIKPKFDIRETPADPRKPRPGETLVSLRGSPVVCEEHGVPDSVAGWKLLHSATRGIDSDAHHGEGELQASEVDDIDDEKLFEGVEDLKKQ